MVPAGAREVAQATEERAAPAVRGGPFDDEAEEVLVEIVVGADLIDPGVPPEHTVDLDGHREARVIGFRGVLREVFHAPPSLTSLR
ncbi:hypothetical protein ACSCBZ_34025 [Streptomyces niveiscabiei]